jgi:hypothetical protein
MVKEPGRYAWSSYRAYASDGGMQPWLGTKDVWRQFSRNVGVAGSRIESSYASEWGQGTKENIVKMLARMPLR